MIELVQSLRRVANHLDDIRGIALSGADGLVVEALQLDPLVDLSALAAELSVSLKELGGSAEGAGMGALSGFQLNTTEGLVLVARVNDNHFVMMVVKPDGNSGRARFYLEIEAGRLAAELA
jgi:predicted regulator of Ras-like GTPase activity (Roadblock/LC7/MglB family)